MGWKRRSAIVPGSTATCRWSDSVRVGIDASNIRAGGGLTHLMELLRAAQPQQHGVSNVIVWGSHATLSRLPIHPWLEASNQAALDGSALQRIVWQQTTLTRLARRKCDVLFVPGGSYAGTFVPFVA